MRSVYSLVFVGCVSFTGFAAHAQPGGGLSDIDALIQSMSVGGASSGLSVDTVVAGVSNQLLNNSQTEQQTPIIQGPLSVADVVPEVNRIVASALIGDSRVGRYAPRLNINFAEFPLRSLTDANRSNNGANEHGVRAGTRAEIVVRRIQNRLQGSEFQLAIEDRTAVVSGTVATDRERKQIELMLRFEPGISAVKNELMVMP